MYKLYATIKKDFRILMRDKVGLTLMFAMKWSTYFRVRQTDNNRTIGQQLTLTNNK